MKRLIAAGLMAVSLTGCAHTDWLVPAAAGVAVGAAIASHPPIYSRPVYVAPAPIYVPPAPVYIPPPVIYRYPRLECHRGFQYCYYR